MSTDHKDLIEALRSLAGMVVLSGYPNSIYSDLLSGWETYSTTSRISAGRGTKVKNECVWINQSCAAALKNIGGLFA